MPRRFIELDFYDEKADETIGTVLISPAAIETIRPHYGGEHHDEGVWSHTTVHMRSGEIWKVNASIDEIEDAIDALAGQERGGDLPMPSQQ